MNHKLAVLTTAFACFAAAADRPWPEQYVEESTAAGKACGAKDYPACRQHLLRIRELLDGRADIIYRLAKVEAEMNNSEASLEWLTLFSKSGLTFIEPGSDPDFAGLKQESKFAEATARIAAARVPVTSSRLFLTLSQADLIAEDIAYDPRSARFFVSSVRHGKILAFNKDGKVVDFLPEGLPGVWGVLALGVDARRRVLWATTAAMPEFSAFTPDLEGRSALLKISLESGDILKRYDLRAGERHSLGDMVVGNSGDVFVSDSFGSVYWMDHRRDSLEVLIGPGVFRSPQTPALTPDGRRLFVADYTRGISVVDLVSKAVHLVAHPPELSLGGIDGLDLVGNTLIAIQNGTQPRRVIRMEMDASLKKIVSWKTKEANWEGLGDPTHGVVVGRQFYFLVNSGWDQLADNGSLKPGGLFTPAVIRRMELDRKP